MQTLELPRNIEELTTSELVRYRELLKSVLQRERCISILSYEPHRKQLLFHKSQAKIRAIFGGNQSGKTYGGGAEFFMHMLKQYPSWYPKENRCPEGKILKGRIGAADFQKGVNEVIIPEIEKWVDTSMLAKKPTRNTIGVPVKYHLKNGNQFDIMTYEQKLEQFEGWQGDIAWFDEPPPRDRYIATLRGLITRKGKIWLTLTPLKEPWLFDEIYSSTSPDTFCITVDMIDNPYLDTNEINKFSDSIIDDATREARIHGKFKHLTGLIYNEFSIDSHVIDPIKVKPTWTRYFAIDPHPRTPTMCLWLAVDENENLFIYDELWLKDMSIRQIAMAIKAQEGKVSPQFRFIDPALDKEDALMGGVNVRKELMRYGIACQRANNDIHLGIDRVRDVLRVDYLPLTGNVSPRLHVCKHCEHTIYEFTHYMWGEYLTRPESHEKMNKPKKIKDHAMDCLRYILNAEPRYMIFNKEKRELSFKGEYAKYASESEQSSSYYDLVERKL